MAIDFCSSSVFSRYVMFFKPLLDAVVLPGSGRAGRRSEAGAPVLGRLISFNRSSLADVFEPFVDELPGARAVGVDFAPVFARAAAGPFSIAWRSG